MVENRSMASIPAGALILTMKEALNYWPQWTPRDRATAREWIEITEVTDFYTPPSGGYVAGHGGPNRSAYRDMPVNGLLMHVGFLHAWPNDVDALGDERIQLSNFTATGISSQRHEQPHATPTKVCSQCNLAVPGHADECDNCGYDFAATRAASIARWHEFQRRRANHHE